MPFSLGKSEKRSKDEGAALEETPEDSEDASSADGDNGAQESGPSAVADPPATGGRAKKDKAYRPPTFRPDYLDEEAGREGAAAAPARDAPRGDTFFVSVIRQDGSEVHRFDNPAKVQAFVEELLGEGIPQEEVTAFSGRKLALEVSHHPIVKLFSGQED